MPDAAICLDASHLIKWTNEALELVLREHYRGQPAKQFRHDRYLLRSGAESLPVDKHQLLLTLRRKHRQVGRAHERKEGLRSLFRDVRPADARHYLTGWIKAAERSSLRPVVLLAQRVRKHLEGIPPVSSSDCPTAASKASTPRSDSSTLGPTATTASSHTRR